MPKTFDVAVIGFGPVGMTMAALLGRAGHSVVVVERYEGLYGLPRAATFDDETMRTFARVGIADTLLPLVHYQPRYEWCNADGELLMEYAYAANGWSGWSEWYQMNQPDVEDALYAACLKFGVEVLFGAAATRYDQTDDGVTISTSKEDVHARYVVAADGGNGFSRAAIGTDLTDFGFSEPWLVCDFRYESNPGAPMARQIGDPKQPTSIIALGPTHHRFSFMLDSVEDFGVEKDPERVWARVEPYLQRSDAELVRVATYTFRSLLADNWRSGRVLLAGDAAHQMPPFLGQGMCSGIRDAENLSFKLDLVLRDEANETILDSYQSERMPHVTAIIKKGIELGRTQTLRDPAAAAARDRRLLEVRSQQVEPEKLRFPSLLEGLLATPRFPGRGSLMPQGRIRHDGRIGRYDEFHTPGFQLIVSDEKTRERLETTASVPFVDIVTIAPADDVDGVYHDWLRGHQTEVVLVRPDAYIFGSATADDAEMLLHELEQQLVETR